MKYNVNEAIFFTSRASTALEKVISQKVPFVQFFGRRKSIHRKIEKKMSKLAKQKRLILVVVLTKLRDITQSALEGV